MWGQQLGREVRENHVSFAAHNAGWIPGQGAPLHNKGGEPADQYGISVLLTIKTSSTDTAGVFLPRRYTQVFSDVDIGMINDRMIKISFIFHGTFERTSVCSRYNWFNNIKK
jgi:hypothetical protein